MEEIEFVEMELVQEAVANWESLEDVEKIGTRELYVGDTEGRAFLSRIQLRDMDRPIYIEVRLFGEEGDAMERLFKNGLPVIAFQNELPVMWQ